MKPLSIVIIVLSLILLVQLYFYFNTNFGGKTMRLKIECRSLKGNILNEPSERYISVYLPKGYSTSNQDYPTIYLLHGFRSDDGIFNSFNLKNELDFAIENKLIQPVIVVAPNSNTLFGGSFYTNSKIAGNWADYVAKDVVNYIDSNFRTIKSRSSRGISGHSMGGHGALKIAMLYPDIFGAVYAMSPSILFWAKELSIKHKAFEKIADSKNLVDLNNELYAFGFLAMGSIYSPMANYPPFNCKMPLVKKGMNMEIDESILAIWEKQFPLKMVSSHINSLKSLNGIGFDWGKFDEFEHLPVTCRLLDMELNKFNIRHSAVEYEGRHSDKITGKDSRILNGLIPFFNSHLKH